jgi:hypothetical protein
MAIMVRQTNVITATIAQIATQINTMALHRQITADARFVINSMQFHIIEINLIYTTF